uniref:Muscarinic acetylcholine receptor n=2 Tax=Latimeria chalumnae TaxID=7897 RepID=M3XL82_LATCH
MDFFLTCSSICQKIKMIANYNNTSLALFPNISFDWNENSQRTDLHAENRSQDGSYDIFQTSGTFSSITVAPNISVKQNITYDDPLGGHTVWQVVLIALFTGILALVTIIGNILVMVSFKVNKQLKTVNNYFLLSLAFADIIIGIFSMNLFTTYIIMGKWALGNLACDLWLTIDYVASNASVMNLLVISFDRYFSITRPLTYRAKRTTKRAGVMIGLAWVVSFILWAPAILFWQYFVGERTVPPDQCFIQFLTEPIITFGTAIAAFYLPVTIMTILYWRIYKETEKRTKELAGLQASHRDVETTQFIHQTGSSRSCSSYELQQSSAKHPTKRKFGRCTFWPTAKTWKPNTEGEQEHSSSDSWNNNDAAASLDNSASSDEEVIETETRAIYSIVLKLPGHKAIIDSNLPSVEDLDMSEDELQRLDNSRKERRPRRQYSQQTDDEGNSFEQCFSKLPIQPMSSIGTSKTSETLTSLAKTSASMPLSLKDASLAKRFAIKTRTQITKRKRLSLVKEKKA